MYLGENVVVLKGYTLTGPTIFCYIISRSHYGGHINYFYQITARALVHANGSPHSHHLHQPWLQTGTSILGAQHTCAWCHSIKGQVCLALCSLFG